ncbi:hypothetical protein [Bartonella schoenbuchensis]|uniref:Right handed beta helix domain-containing protein n=1 Tax=Bartonella schoenbuchensis m07a TaxID=1094496 RepID=N6VC10_9HYPH|nr:hypothetical protein [Bartonella schoenbuchensis]ENN91340.1 hypothetical protein m07a_02120 [Bartonella schoenbuchensis m07a]
MSVGGGTVELSGGVKIAGTTMGLRVAGGSATMMGGKITGGGVGDTGVSVGSGTVELSGGVKILKFATGVKVSKGTFKMIGGGITGGGTGAGVSVTGGDVTLEGITISGVGTGVNMGGTGRLTMNNVTIKGEGESGGYGVMVDTSGEVKLNTVNISRVETEVYAKKGTLIMERGSVTEFTETGVIPVMCHTDLN